LDVVCGPNGEQELHPEHGRSHVANASRDLAISFLRLANLDNDIVDRLSRYEARSGDSSPRPSLRSKR
jgi:hypothetical protein